MLAKASLVLTLLVSLLFVTQVQPRTVSAEMQRDGVCAEMRCDRGCCANVACCKVAEQHKTPQAPRSAPHSAPVQLAAIELRAYTILLIPPAARHPFVILDEPGAAHTLSPLAVSCIRLI